VTPELDRTRPVWRQVAAAITSRIAGGEYALGARVPSVVELSAEFGIATSTAQKSEGLIRAEVGLGSFVAQRPSEEAEPTT
jgi:DNA-binding transcriptional regulator YhcF (GntR family)